MRRNLLILLAGLLTSSGLAWAQDAPAPKTLLAASGATAPAAGDVAVAAHPLSGGCGVAACFTDCCDQNRYRIWVSGDYLLWWTKDGPNPVPLVTTGDPKASFPGALGQPSTRVLFGGDDLDYGSRSGFRGTIGGWLGGDQRLGWEVSGLLLGQGSVNFAVASDANSNPVLAVPFLSTTSGETSVILSTPKSSNIGAGKVTLISPIPTGSVAIESTSRVWGMEGNGLLSLTRRRGFSVDLLAGLRYLDLDEDQAMNFTSETVGNGGVLTRIQANDAFHTRNQFWGGQVGTRVTWRTGRWTGELVGKVALGSTHQIVAVSGQQTESFGGSVTDVRAGGIFAQPSNSGRRSDDQFSVVPEVEVKLGYQLTQRLRASVGYNFLYWDRVVRPGDQIDRNINYGTGFAGTGQDLLILGFAQNVNPGGPPSPRFNITDYWAHGVNFGLEFRY